MTLLDNSESVNKKNGGILNYKCLLLISSDFLQVENVNLNMLPSILRKAQVVRL